MTREPRPVVTRLLQVTSSKVLGSGLAFAFSVLVARLLGPEQYGLLAVSFAVTAVTAEVTGYGFETALVRFAAPILRSGDRGRAAEAGRVVLRVKLVVNGGLVLASLALARPVASLLGDPAYGLPIQVGVAGGLGLSLWRFTLSVLQALEAFGTYALVQSANGVIKVAALAGVVLAAGLDLPLALSIHVASFFASFLLGVLLCPPDLRRLTGGTPPDVTRTILRFSAWIVPASFCSIFNSWLGVLVLGYFAGPRLVGEFAAALMIVGVLEILMVSLNTILLPMACRISTRETGFEFARKALGASGLLSLALLPVYVVAPILFPLLYSTEFRMTSDLFRILFWGFLVSLNVEPMILVLYGKNYPRRVMGLELSKLLLSLIAYLVLVPAFSVTGAAAAASLGRFAGGVLGAAAAYLVLRDPSAGPADRWVQTVRTDEGVR